MTDNSNTSRIIHLDSHFFDNVDKDIDGSLLTSGSFNVDLQADINQHIYIRTKHVSIPYTFYQINSNTFRLDYTLYDSVTDVVKENTTKYIDHGNYNVNGMIAWFASNTPFTCTFSK